MNYLQHKLDNEILNELLKKPFFYQNLVLISICTVRDDLRIRILGTT